MNNYMPVLKKEMKYRRLSFLIASVYGVIYYWSTGYMVLTRPFTFDLYTVDRWQHHMFKIRAPFLWEPVSSLTLPIGLTIQISPMNLIIMLLLVILVFLNVFIFVLSIKKPMVCRLKNKKSRLFALVPALFTGFSCCAPTFIIAFISIIGTTASTFILITRWAIPVSMLLLIYGVYLGNKKIFQSSYI